jgi:hypothetical protein
MAQAEIHKRVSGGPADYRIEQTDVFKESPMTHRRSIRRLTIGMIAILAAAAKR